jgi:ATP-binding cassette subfamily B protein
VVGLVLTLVTSALELIPSILVGRSLDILITQGFGGEFIILAVFIILIAFANWFTTFFSNYVFAVSSFAYERDVRQEFFEIMLAYPMNFHNEHDSSRLLSLGTNEIQFARHSMFPHFRIIIQIMFSIGITSWYVNMLVSQELAILLVSGFFLYFFVAFLYARKVVPIREKSSDVIGDLSSQSQEIFKGIEVVRSLSAQTKESEKFSLKSDAYAALKIKEERLSAFYLPNLIFLGINAITLLYLLNYVSQGFITVGTLVQVILMLVTIQFVSSMLPMLLINIQAAFVNTDRLYQAMTWTNGERMQGTLTTNWEGDIEFKDVSFSYGDREVLSRLNFTLPAKSKIALIGGPGSGKSTLIKLLLGLYSVDSGTITIGGVNYQNLPEVEIRNHISSVEQDIFLFSGTIRDNIAFTKSYASDSEIIAAASAAQIMGFISKLPKGLDTEIGERGVKLSGGQKQRLAIARAILADPDVLLLDDSSSAIDSKTEMLIRKALDNLSKDRLTITVTQRLNTLVSADLLILLERGRLIGFGTHQELLRDNEKYQRIFELLPESEQLVGGRN